MLKPSLRATRCRCAALAILAVFGIDAIVATEALAATPSAAASTAATTAAIQVLPRSGLLDGQSVQVRVSGFDPGSKVWLSECATAADVNPYGCGEQLPAQPFLLPDDRGAAVGTFIVRATAYAHPYDTSVLHACTACVLMAVEGVVAGHAPLPTAATPLAFATLPMTGSPTTTTFVAGVLALTTGLLLVLGTSERHRFGRFLTFR